MTTTEQLYRQALEQICNNDYRGGRHTAIDIVFELRKIARTALTQADAARDPFSGPRGERCRRELLREARAEGRDRNGQ